MATHATAEKVDFTKTLRDLYSASGTIKEVDVGKGTYLYVEGQGEPGGVAFQRAINDLYGVAYGVKFALKKAGGIDYTISKLECLWYLPDSLDTPMSEWRWRVMVRVPDQVTKKHLHDALDAVLDKRGARASNVELTTWSEGRALQVLHVGPYDGLQETYAKLMRRMRDKGLSPAGPGHEIYLSDPNRATPERLRTIVRMPVR